ncbi:MAG: glycosyltransferase family 2 protein [Candidatus Komeilibacteria bacterium]|jgi:GT2 family glycosyltransferase|nr:glycosyltransferase family 2 protein [Candidatus Komeilibacteria bacterium]MBT4447644.1 glycosyltransferase family 2 protein [Candidatus Komeilibacteria bacterium]
MQKKPTVTISLLTWNGQKYLPWLLKSLSKQSFKDWELLVLDNASTDKSVDIIREYYPKARIVHQKQNIGFAKGHNLLINWSNSDYILVLNQDLILEPNYIRELVDFLQQNTKVASCSGKLMYWNFKAGLKTKTIDSYGFKIDKKREVTDRYQGRSEIKIDNEEVFGLSATATLYRRKALEIIAGQAKANHFQYFDEDFFAYKEDIDLAWRLRLFAWENWLVTTTKAYHHRSVSKGKDLKESRKTRGFANKLSYRNHLMLLYKNSFYKNLFKDFLAIKWYEFKKFVYLLLFERSTLVGVKEYFANIPSLAKKRKYIMRHRKVNADEIYKWFEK